MIINKRQYFLILSKLDYLLEKRNQAYLNKKYDQYEGYRMQLKLLESMVKRWFKEEHNIELPDHFFYLL